MTNMNLSPGDQQSYDIRQVFNYPSCHLCKVRVENFSIILAVPFDSKIQ